MSERVRYQFYRTKDDEFVLFMALEDKFWQNFCKAVNRMDLSQFEEAATDQREQVRTALTGIFKTRTRAEWTQFFIDNNVAGAPCYRGAEVLEDPHVRAQGIVYEQIQPDGSALRLIGSPIRLPYDGAGFAATRPPL